MRISDWSSDVCSSDLPFVAIFKELGLVVDQLLARFSRKFEIRALDDRIHRAGFLAETTIDALRHVDVVARCAAAAVCPRFSLDRNRLRSEEHTSELQSLMRISYAVFCLKKKKKNDRINIRQTHRK